jgi:hypothetical protein
VTTESVPVPGAAVPGACEAAGVAPAVAACCVVAAGCAAASVVVTGMVIAVVSAYTGTTGSGHVVVVVTVGVTVVVTVVVGLVTLGIERFVTENTVSAGLTVIVFPVITLRPGSPQFLTIYWTIQYVPGFLNVYVGFLSEEVIPGSKVYVHCVVASLVFNDVSVTWTVRGAGPSVLSTEKPTSHILQSTETVLVFIFGAPQEEVTLSPTV